MRRKGSRKETPKSFEVDDACSIVQGGESGQVVNGEASIDVLNGGDDFLDGE